MKLCALLAVLALALPPSAPGAPANDHPILGFSPQAVAGERALEARFDTALQREHLREWMRVLSAHPHHLGSPYDRTNAEFMASLFRSWGYETRLERFDVLFPSPKTRLLEMTAPTAFTALLTEPGLPEDRTSNDKDDRLPPYNAYSIDGDVTGRLVYVNYGTPKDYETLEEYGVSVTGKVVIARYGGAWRGIKPKVAAEHGAVGCVIFSDPKDDGYFRGDSYPAGSWRPDQGAQRGSVADVPLYPGDPLTPGVGATPEAKRLPLSEARTLTKIPVLPISYADALPLLKALSGPVAPEAWRGALPLTYHLGPGPAVVHLKLAFNWDTVPLYDVIAVLQGTQAPDQWVIRGNHHDGWVFGAADPLSGTVALLEEARVVGELAAKDWKPRRTVVYAVWDGEEPGLLGSTEWVETHAAELKLKAVAYVNSDGNERGVLSAGGSHTLEKFTGQVARDVSDPDRGVSVWERWRARQVAKAAGPERAELRSRIGLRLDALGSGSDYTPFLQHLGIASLNLGYNGDEGGGTYHSVYDSYAYYTRFVDTNSEYGLVLARTAGRCILRLANAEVLPFAPDGLSEALTKFVAEVQKEAEDLRQETREVNLMIRDHTLALAADTTRPFFEPKPKAEVPFLNFAPLQNALLKVQNAVREFDKAAPAGYASVPTEKRMALDALMRHWEQSLTRAEGLPRRPWYQHFVYAPGAYTGYGVKTLPAVREAIEQRDWEEAGQQIVATAAALEHFASQVDKARALLR